jgi:hypothetical protein
MRVIARHTNVTLVPKTGPKSVVGRAEKVILSFSVMAPMSPAEHGGWTYEHGKDDTHINALGGGFGPHGRAGVRRLPT